MLMRKNLRLEAGWGFERKHFIRAIPMLEKHAHLFEGFVSHVLPLEDVSKGFDALHGSYNLDGKDAIKIAVEGGAA